MARPLRVAFAGAWSHVTARGNERFVLFRSDADRKKWLELLANR
jgi:putative transposase